MFNKSGISVEFNHTLLCLLRCWEGKDDQVHCWVRLLTSWLCYFQSIDWNEGLSCPVGCHGLYLQREGILLYIMARKGMDTNQIKVEMPVCVALCFMFMGVLKTCVSWGNKVKAHKTVCLAVWGWRYDKLVKYWFSPWVFRSNREMRKIRAL